MKTKRFLSLMLSVVMLFGMTTAFASVDTTAATDTVDVYSIISNGIASSTEYIQNELDSVHLEGGVSYGFEWYIITLLRAGKDINEAIVNEYFDSAASAVAQWTAQTPITDIERTALALTAMGKDITDINGVDISSQIYSSENLSGNSNGLAYALLALDAVNIAVPDTAHCTKDEIITTLLSFQTTEGSFGLSDASIGSVDMTAICLQALAPYKSDETVAQAIENALTFLRSSISADYSYNNSNTTAQVLLALASLGIDVTDSSEGFGNESCNIITALEAYKNPSGNGYLFGDTVDSMTTVQVMQAYDAYRKAHKEGILYWDFTTAGAVYDDNIPDDTTPGEDNDPTDMVAEPANVYVTIVSDGSVVQDKNGSYVAQAPVTVTDKDENGKLTYDEALYATHEAYYENGAAEGYVSHTTTFGLSLARLWGNGSTEAPTVAGYYLNNASCWSLDDEVKDGDYLTAFNYFDTLGYSDSYSYFTETEVSLEQGASVTLTLNALSYDPDWNLVPLPCAGANVAFLGSNNALQEVLTTDNDGKVNINFTSASGVGSYYVMAYKDDSSIVPAICRINVTSGNNSESGGSLSDNISVYIRVADPKNITYFKKTVCSVEKGTSAYELLQKTGLDIVVAQSPYGSYVKEIEGLAEFDEGSESGWMYRVNGKFSSHSASLYSLSNGDYVEWLYTRDLGKDLGDNSFRGSSSGSSKPKEEKTEDETDEPEQKPDSEQKLVFNDDIYKDVNPDDWHYEAVKYAYNNNLMKGTDEGFEPESKMTRAMLITVLWRLEKEPTVKHQIGFDDIKADEWYTEAVRWAASENIISGIGNNLFGTNDEITREQMATIFYRYVQSKGISTQAGKTAGIKDYADSESISDYAVLAMEWAVDFGIIQGKTENAISPADSATRAEVATMLMRFCEGITK